LLRLLTKSRIRQRIISLFIYNQNREFYLTEIARKAGTSPGTAQRELNRLLENDFLTFRKNANLNYYRLNKRFRLLKEVESIIKKTIGIEQELSRELGKMKDIEFAFLFGSYVKGGFKSDSDVDLFIVGEADEEALFPVVQKLEHRIDRDINFRLACRKEFKRRVGSDDFLKDIVKNYSLLIGDEREFRNLIG
jgi:predicted nucleotidyltransferase